MEPRELEGLPCAAWAGLIAAAMDAIPRRSCPAGYRLPELAEHLRAWGEGFWPTTVVTGQRGYGSRVGAAYVLHYAHALGEEHRPRCNPRCKALAVALMAAEVVRAWEPRARAGPDPAAATELTVVAVLAALEAASPREEVVREVIAEAVREEEERRSRSRAR